MKALILVLVLIPPFIQAQSTQDTDCGSDYVCFYQKEARELESYRYKQLEYQEQQISEMRRQNDLLEQQLQDMRNRQMELENSYMDLQQELRELENTKQAQEEQQAEEEQLRLEEIP